MHRHPSFEIWYQCLQPVYSQYIWLFHHCSTGGGQCDAPICLVVAAVYIPDCKPISCTPSNHSVQNFLLPNANFPTQYNFPHMCTYDPLLEQITIIWCICTAITVQYVALCYWCTFSIIGSMPGRCCMKNLYGERNGSRNNHFKCS